MRDLSKREMKYLVCLALNAPHEVIDEPTIKALKKDGLLSRDGSISDKGRTFVELLRHHTGK